jgi:hypothetical protein
MVEIEGKRAKGGAAIPDIPKSLRGINASF